MFNEARSRIEASLDSCPSNSISACDNSQQAIRRKGCSTSDSLNHTEVASMSIVAGSVSDSQRQGGNMVLFLCSPPSMELLRLQQRKRGSFQIWTGHLHLSSCRLRIPLFYCIREHSLRNPEDTFYKRLAAECRRVQIFIDAFSFCGRYADLASVVFLPRYSGGQANSHISIDTRRDTMSLLAALSISRLHHEARRRQTAS